MTHNKSIVAVKSIYEVRKNQVQMKNEQDATLSKNGSYFSQEIFKDKSGNQIVSEVIDSIEKEVETLKIFDNSVKEFKGAIPFGVRNNKMVIVLESLIKEAKENENFILDIIEGKKPKGFDNTIEKGILPKIGAGEYWGSSKSTILSAAATFIDMFKTGKTLEDTLDLGKSSIAHAFDLPEGFNIESRYLTNSKLSFIHSGYSFGGARSNIKEPAPKEFAPEDCGTFIEKICMTQQIASGAVVTTADLLCVWRHGGTEYIPDAWNQGASYNLVKLFTANQTQQDTIGSVFFTRSFNDGTENNSLGIAGHTAIIIGRDKDEYITVGVNRDMPGIEGCGIQNFLGGNIRKSETTHRNAYALDPTNIVLDEISDSFGDIVYSGMQDLHTVVNFFDEKLLSGSNLDDEDLG